VPIFYISVNQIIKIAFEIDYFHFESLFSHFITSGSFPDNLSFWISNYIRCCYKINLLRFNIKSRFSISKIPIYKVHLADFMLGFFYPHCLVSCFKNPAHFLPLISLILFNLHRNYTFLVQLILNLTT
jgi:hypothetical protein